MESTQGDDVRRLRAGRWVTLAGAFAAWGSMLLVCGAPWAQDGGGFVRPEPAEMGASDTSAVGAPDAAETRVSASQIKAQLEDQLVAGVARPQIDLTIRFEFNSAKLTDIGRLDLDEAGEAINRHFREKRFVLAGHTDPVGTEAYNLALSRDRAEAAREYLIEAHGISSERLEAVGFGESQPLPGQPDEANRRVSLELIR